MDKLTSVRHKNNRDIWIVTRVFPGDKFVSFLLTPNGISPYSVISESFKWIEITTSMPWQNQIFAELKISPNGKKMATGYDHLGLFEIGNFDIATGEYTHLFGVDPPDLCDTCTYTTCALEFSPDSRLLYVSSRWQNSFNEPFYQYDAMLTDSLEFGLSVRNAGNWIGVWITNRT